MAGRGFKGEEMSKIVKGSEQPKPAEPTTGEAVPVYRRCPICWGARHGVGTAYSTQGNTRYYKCTSNTDGPGCGHTWSALVRLEVVKIESRTVELSERQPPE